MELSTKFKNIDNILKHIDRPEYHNSMFSIDDIQKELFPNENVDTVQSFIEYIETSKINPPIAKLKSGRWIYRTVHTKHFLEDGGFTKMYAESISKAQRQTEIDNLELQRLRSENLLLLEQLAEFPKIKSDRNRIFIIAVIELLIILVGLFLQWKK